MLLGTDGLNSLQITDECVSSPRNDSPTSDVNAYSPPSCAWPGLASYGASCASAGESCGGCGRPAGDGYYAQLPGGAPAVGADGRARSIDSAISNAQIARVMR